MAEQNQLVTSTIAKSDDGTIQINFNFPWPIVTAEEKKVLDKEKEVVTVQGFRKGMAPIEKVRQAIPKEKLVEKILQNVLPKALSEAIGKFKITPALYPKFELISANDNETWQVRTTTCELPTVELGNYKKAIEQEAKSRVIWTPDKGKDAPKETSQQEKEEAVLKVLLSSVKINIPKILIEEEVNTKLSRLLEKIEKLGLSLDAYLNSIGKDVKSLREEYTKQAEESLKIELILNKIAAEENIQIKEKEIEETLKALTSGSQTQEVHPEQKQLIASVLKRREALAQLTKLV